MLSQLGKILMGIGLFLLIVGLVLYVSPRVKIPFLGRLPGDILIEKKNFIFYFPLTTSIIISILLTVILYFFFRK